MSKKDYSVRHREAAITILRIDDMIMLTKDEKTGNNEE
ncbi:hypothetical protein ACP4OV_011592 [Aristida adscensionis]